MRAPNASPLAPLALAIVLAPLALACDRSGSRGAPDAAAPSGPTEVDASSARDAAPAPLAAGACAPSDAVVLPSSSRAVDIRIAAHGAKALVTWTEPPAQKDGPEGASVVAHVFDTSTSPPKISPRVVVDKSSFSDSPLSGGAPVAYGDELAVVSCFYGAPTGDYRCSKRAPSSGARPETLFAFGEIAVGGPSIAGIAAVTRGDDTLVFVPAVTGDGLHAFSARVSAKRTTHPFPYPEDAAPKTDGLTALALGAADAALVYRSNGAIKVRRVGPDAAWKGKPVDLSAKDALVGSPVAVADGETVVAVFSERAKSTDPWRLVLVEWTPGADPKRTPLPTGDAQAQGPGLAKLSEPGCFLVSWVEGSGKATRTKLGRFCNGTLTASSVVTLTDGEIEGGRAYLPADPTFLLWQQIPPGAPAELRVAKLACK